MSNPFFPDKLDENSVPVLGDSEIIKAAISYAQARANLLDSPVDAAVEFLKNYSAFYQELSKDEAEETLNDDEMLV